MPLTDSYSLETIREALRKVEMGEPLSKPEKDMLYHLKKITNSNNIPDPEKL